MRPALFDRMKKAWEFDPKIVFDVGANEGLFTVKFGSFFPDATIYAFEPGERAMNKFIVNTEGKSNIRPFKLVVDATDGECRFSVNKGKGNHLLRQDEKGGELTEKISGDSFCAREGIPRIDFLKIDTEGNDLNVLAGFSSLLKEAKIGWIQVECTTNLDNRFHAHLERFIHFLHPFGYRLFEIVGHTRLCYATRQMLRGSWFCDAIFVCEVPNPKLRTSGNN
jgi:FkbM family methyltransferase